jgi:hypothetical protein
MMDLRIMVNKVSLYLKQSSATFIHYNKYNNFMYRLDDITRI